MVRRPYRAKLHCLFKAYIVMKLFLQLFAGTIASQLSLVSTASEPTGLVDTKLGVYFQRKDWELACDNTLACKAAGYSAEDEQSLAATILLSRKAGPNTPIKVTLRARMDTGQERSGSFRLLGSGLQYPLDVQLSESQSRAVLAHMRVKNALRLIVDNEPVSISLAGYSAIAIKFDDVQGRLGTPSALSRLPQNSRHENDVLRPLLTPTIVVPRLPVNTPVHPTTRAAIVTAIGPTECSVPDPEVIFDRLNARETLVSFRPCERGPYNSEGAFYVVQLRYPHQARRVLNEVPVSEFRNGILSGYQKGRGLSDCVTTMEFAWTGSEFRKSDLIGSGMCRGYPGGAWDMQTFISNVRNPNQSAGASR
jgi:hypothetical protein